MTLGLKTKKRAFILNKSKPLYVSKESTFNQVELHGLLTDIVTAALTITIKLNNCT